MEKSLLAARVSLFVALISAFEIYGQTKDSRSVSLVVIAFFAAVFWRDWRFQSFDFFGDLSLERLKLNRRSVFVFGNRIESAKPEAQERDVLLDQELLRCRMQSIIGYWSVIAAFGALMHWRFGVFPFSGTVLVAFLICFPLSFATHYTQQLIPLFLSLLGILITLWKGEFPAKTLLVVYTLSSFATIAFLQNIRLNFISKSFGSSTWLQDVLKRALIAGIGFCVLVYAVTKIFPERTAAAATAMATRPEAKDETRKQAIETVAKQLVKLEKRRESPKPKTSAQNEAPQASGSPSEPTNESPSPGGGTPKSGESQPRNAALDPEALKKLMAMQTPKGGSGIDAKEPKEGPSGGADGEPREGNVPARDPVNDEAIAQELAKKTPEELESLKQQLDHEIAKAEHAAKHPEETKLPQTEAQQPQTQTPSPSSLKPEDIAKLQKQLANQDPKAALANLEKLHHLQKQVEQTQQTKSKTASTANGNGKHEGNGITNSLNKRGSPNPTAGTNPQGEPANPQTTSANTDPNPNANPNVNPHVNANAHVKPSPGPAPNPDDLEEADRVKELAQEIDKKLERIENFAPYVVFGLIGLVIGIWIVKWMRRSQKKEVVLTLTEEEKKELSEELRNIRERKLTAQQEIIETYNVMMDVLERVQLGRQEGLPARVHALDLKKRLPKMGSSVFEATDGFDAALYGDLDPGGEQLAKFRKSTKSVFKQFDIAS